MALPITNPGTALLTSQDPLLGAAKDGGNKDLRTSFNLGSGVKRGTRIDTRMVVTPVHDEARAEFEIRPLKMHSRKDKDVISKQVNTQ